MKYVRVIFPVAVEWNGPLYEEMAALTDKEIRERAIEIFCGLTTRQALHLVRGPLMIEQGESDEQRAASS